LSNAGAFYTIDNYNMLVRIDAATGVLPTNSTDFCFLFEAQESARGQANRTHLLPILAKSPDIV
jgi:hypothetical protein